MCVYVVYVCFVCVSFLFSCMYICMSTCTCFCLYACVCTHNIPVHTTVVREVWVIISETSLSSRTYSTNEEPTDIVVRKFPPLLLILYYSSSSDLQPSTAIANQSLGKSVSTYLNHNDPTTCL